jgi:NAD(P)-dependent dehydrogenase (short-subunit alcohol dehydrogenase family)
MKNKVVLITGANGGLGASITRSFLATGASVTGISNKISAEQFPQPNFTPISADLTKASTVNDVVQSVVKREGRIDILIHVLGAFAGGKSIAETDDATWEQMQDLNLSSAFYVLRAAIPHLRKSGNGRIVAIGSLAAVEPHAGIGAYVTFKSALVSLVGTVAVENRDAGVTANVILPDTMDTPGNRKDMPDADPSKWVATQDVAALALWLADDRAVHITGAAFPIAGKS